MNKEEFIGKLEMVYVGDRNAIDEIVEDNQKLKNEVVYSKVEIDRLNNIINYIWQVFENGGFEDGCDCIKIYDYLKELKENNKDAC